MEATSKARKTLRHFANGVLKRAAMDRRARRPVMLVCCRQIHPVEDRKNFTRMLPAVRETTERAHDLVEQGANSLHAPSFRPQPRRRAV